MIARFFIAIGAPLVAFVRYLGEVVLLAADTFRSILGHGLLTPGRIVRIVARGASQLPCALLKAY